MCGRLVLADPIGAVEELLDIVELPAEWPTRYNLAPTDRLPIVRVPGRLELLRWGMRLANPRAGGFNARRESMGLYDTTKRCLVVASGFYEWRRGAGPKVPHLLRRADGKPLVFAGLFDDTDGVAVVTAPGEGIVRELHDRMPVVLERRSFASYLDPRSAIDAFLAPASADSLVMYPVGPGVGDVRNDNASLIERVEPARFPEQLGLF